VPLPFCFGMQVPESYCLPNEVSASGHGRHLSASARLMAGVEFFSSDLDQVSRSPFQKDPSAAAVVAGE
jgi:hypothetical protein